MFFHWESGGIGIPPNNMYIIYNHHVIYSILNIPTPEVERMGSPENDGNLQPRILWEHPGCHHFQVNQPLDFRCVGLHQPLSTATQLEGCFCKAFFEPLVKSKTHINLVARFVKKNDRSLRYIGKSMLGIFSSLFLIHELC